MTTTPPALLAVDWDWFFPNPMLITPTRDDWSLYDWSCAENHEHEPSLPDVIWTMRAAAFLTSGHRLPACTGWRHFWDRFTGIANARLVVRDSNAPAAWLTPTSGDRFSRIDLYDAHHDAGYPGGDNTRVHAGNWMLHHHTTTHGIDLNVHYPPWRTSIDTPGEAEPTAPVTRGIDDGITPVNRVYDTVYLCRSGAWVPPWCDDAFAQFTNLATTATATRAPDPVPAPRGFDHTAAARTAATWHTATTQLLSEGDI